MHALVVSRELGALSDHMHARGGEGARVWLGSGIGLGLGRANPNPNPIPNPNPSPSPSPSPNPYPDPNPNQVRERSVETPATEAELAADPEAPPSRRLAPARLGIGFAPPLNPIPVQPSPTPNP